MNYELDFAIKWRLGDRARFIEPKLTQFSKTYPKLKVTVQTNGHSFDGGNMRAYFVSPIEGKQPIVLTTEMIGNIATFDFEGNILEDVGTWKVELVLVGKDGGILGTTNTITYQIIESVEGTPNNGVIVGTGTESEVSELISQLEAKIQESKDIISGVDTVVATKLDKGNVSTLFNNAYKIQTYIEETRNGLETTKDDTATNATGIKNNGDAILVNINAISKLLTAGDLQDGFKTAEEIQNKILENTQNIDSNDTELVILENLISNNFDDIQANLNEILTKFTTGEVDESYNTAEKLQNFIKGISNDLITIQNSLSTKFEEGTVSETYNTAKKIEDIIENNIQMISNHTSKLETLLPKGNVSTDYNTAEQIENHVKGAFTSLLLKLNNGNVSENYNTAEKIENFLKAHQSEIDGLVIVLNGKLESGQVSTDYNTAKKIEDIVRNILTEMDLKFVSGNVENEFNTAEKIQNIIKVLDVGNDSVVEALEIKLDKGNVSTDFDSGEKLEGKILEVVDEVKDLENNVKVKLDNRAICVLAPGEGILHPGLDVEGSVGTGYGRVEGNLQGVIYDNGIYFGPAYTNIFNAPFNTSENSTYQILDDGFIRITMTNTGTNALLGLNPRQFKPSTTYTVSVKIRNDKATTDVSSVLIHRELTSSDSELIDGSYTFTTKDDLSSGAYGIYLRINSTEVDGTSAEFRVVITETSLEVPFVPDYAPEGRLVINEPWNSQTHTLIGLNSNLEEFQIVDNLELNLLTDTLKYFVAYEGLLTTEERNKEIEKIKSKAFSLPNHVKTSAKAIIPRVKLQADEDGVLEGITKTLGYPNNKLVKLIIPPKGIWNESVQIYNQDNKGSGITEGGLCGIINHENMYVYESIGTNSLSTFKNLNLNFTFNNILEAEEEIVSKENDEETSQPIEIIEELPKPVEDNSKKYLVKGKLKINENLNNLTFNISLGKGNSTETFSEIGEYEVQFIGHFDNEITDDDKIDINLEVDNSHGLDLEFETLEFYDAPYEIPNVLTSVPAGRVQIDGDYDSLTHSFIHIGGVPSHSDYYMAFTNSTNGTSDFTERIFTTSNVAGLKIDTMLSDSYQRIEQDGNVLESFLHNKGISGGGLTLHRDLTQQKEYSPVSFEIFAVYEGKLNSFQMEEQRKLLKSGEYIIPKDLNIQANEFVPYALSFEGVSEKNKFIPIEISTLGISSIYDIVENGYYCNSDDKFIIGDLPSDILNLNGQSYNIEVKGFGDVNDETKIWRVSYKELTWTSSSKIRGWVLVEQEKEIDLLELGIKTFDISSNLPTGIYSAWNVPQTPMLGLPSQPIDANSNPVILKVFKDPIGTDMSSHLSFAELYCFEHKWVFTTEFLSRDKVWKLVY